MPDLLSFIPLATETVDSIRQRLDTDANAGGDPTTESFVDTTEGGFFWDITQACNIEMARLWDMATTEVPAVAFPAYAWGEYLDDHGETLGLDRKDATVASGIVTFTAANGTLISSGTEVGTLPASGDDAVVFQTTADVTVSGTSADIVVVAEIAGAAGNVAAGTISQVISPDPDITAVNNAGPMTDGSDVETDETYRERILQVLGSPQGAGTIGDYTRWALAYPGIGTVTVTPVWNGPGTVHVVVTDEQQHATSTTLTYALQDYLDPPGVLTTTTASVTLPASTIPVVSTAGMTSTGTIRLANQVVSYTGLTPTTLTGATGGTGTFPSGSRVAHDFGKGRGVAPIGAVVTVDTVAVITVASSATVTFKTGYSLDGTAGTIATRDALNTAIESYINGLPPGQSVILTHVIAQFFKVPGVLDVSSVLLNGSAANVTIGALQVAQASTPTLT